MSWSNQTKNTSSHSNQSKHTSTFNVISYLLCESGDALLQENEFYILIADSPGDKHYSTWSDKSKNTSNFSNKSKSSSTWANQTKH